MLLLLTSCMLTAIANKQASYPESHGILSVQGLDGEVRILRDALGVPHIRATTEHDLWFAVGFVHAQDRLFQMDLMRRVGGGGMSEWMGPDFVPFDTFMLGLEMQRRYTERLPRVDPDLLMVGEAYADGINAGADSLPELPVEYRVLGVDFEPWTINDAMSSSVINSWTLGENAPKEVVTLLLRDRLDRESTDALWRWDPESPPLDDYWDELRSWDLGGINAPFLGLVEVLWGVHDPTNSNNWAVSGEHTASGAPLLANDPHMLQFAPSVWYMFEGSGGDVHIAGGGLPGTPFVASGHNEHVAWGLTNVMADYVDVAVIERVGERGYLLDGEEKQLREVTVDVEVKGGSIEQGTLWWTELGPVITEISGTHLLALRWHLFEVDDGTADMWYAIQRADSVDEVLEAERHPSIISQNLVSADTYGNIAWQPFGSVPQRVGYTGRVPYPASEPGYGWDGWVEMPGSLNPDSGRIATANSKPEDHPDPYAITTSYLPPYRRDRILELLDATDDHTPETFATIQQDEWDPHALESIPELLGTTPLNRCGEVLRDWDGQSGVDSQGALVWAVFQEELIREAITDELGQDGTDLYLAAAISGRSVLDADWEHFVEDRDAAVSVALERTCEILGPEPWRWGEHHRLNINHLFSEESALLDGWSMPHAEWGGSHHTVNQAGYSFSKDLKATWIASMRIITPMDDVGAATFSYPGGQSGMPGHPHYEDLFWPYVQGEMVPLWFWDEDIGEAAVETLLLRPL